MYERSLYRDDVALKALAAKDYDTVNINAGVALGQYDYVQWGIVNIEASTTILDHKEYCHRKSVNIVLRALECFIRKESRL